MNIIAKIRARNERLRAERAEAERERERLEIIDHLNATRGGDWRHAGGGEYADTFTDRVLRVTLHE